MKPSAQNLPCPFIGAARARAARLAMIMLVTLGATLAALTLALPEARAEEYAIGPGRRYNDPSEVTRKLKPGDVVTIDGDATYAGDLVFRTSGTPEAKITVIGRRVNGKRPVLSGGRNTVEFRGSHYLFYGFEITGGASRCLYHHAHDITVIDTAVHDCPKQGILGADSDSGSLTLEYVEVYGCGDGTRSHQLYIATDEAAHHGSVFRMRHSFIHDGRGGNNVKSRAERNELAYNWIEGALYHELELIGPDGQDPKLAREDSDVVGNVIWKTRPGFAIRVGGDGTGDTNGRYRFVNNTVIISPETKAVFRIMDGIESLEVHNNVFQRRGGGGLKLVHEDGSRWAEGRPLLAGTNNWLPEGSTNVPEAFQNTLYGKDPGFADERDLRPADGSPLLGKGARDLPSPPGCPFPAPLLRAESSPPAGRTDALYAVVSRRASGHGHDGRAIAIGAFEQGAFTPGAPPDPSSPLEPGAPGEGGAKPQTPPGPRTPHAPHGIEVEGGCGCRSALAQRGAVPRQLAFALSAAILFPLRRRTRRPR